MFNNKIFSMSKKIILLSFCASIFILSSCLKSKKSCARAHKNKQWINKIQYQ